MRLRVPCVLVAALLLGAGCIQLEETVILERDGSGDILLDYTVPERTVAQIGSLVKVADELSAVAPDAEAGDAPAAESYLALLLNPSEERMTRHVAAYADHGVTLEQAHVESRDAGRRVTLRLSFESLEGLARTDFFKQQGFSLRRLPDGNYRFWRRTGRPVDVEGVDLDDPETVRALTPILGGFQAAIAVRTPGRILRANTPLVSAREATWEFDFNRDPRAFRAFHHQDLAVEFEGIGLGLPNTP